MKEILELNLYIGLTGLSFRTDENLDVLKQIPLEKIVIATDAPFCMTK